MVSGMTIFEKTVVFHHKMINVEKAQKKFAGWLLTVS